MEQIFHVKVAVENGLSIPGCNYVHEFRVVAESWQQAIDMVRGHWEYTTTERIVDIWAMNA